MNRWEALAWGMVGGALVEAGLWVGRRWGSMPARRLVCALMGHSPVEFAEHGGETRFCNRCGHDL